MSSLHFASSIKSCWMMVSMASMVDCTASSMRFTEEYQMRFLPFAASDHSLIAVDVNVVRSIKTQTKQKKYSSNVIDVFGQ